MVFIIFISPFQQEIVLVKLYLLLKQQSLKYTIVVREAKEEVYLKISELFLLLLMQFQFLRIPFYFIIIIKIYIGYSTAISKKK